MWINYGVFLICKRLVSHSRIKNYKLSICSNALTAAVAAQKFGSSGALALSAEKLCLIFCVGNAMGQLSRAFKSLRPVG